MTSRDRVAFVVVPPGYASAEEFAYDCGYELFVPPIAPGATGITSEQHEARAEATASPSTTKMVETWHVELAYQNAASDWVPFIAVYEHRALAEHRASYLNKRNATETCVRITGPHMHRVPA